ncbi:hypothetical protein DOM21_05035 [Bacteriovorax stolpii]|uniref:Serine aminopeptidase S33 domain-containing protein n=1 Tax=Bacteriovorax stolpii TaxID=960 RepID=A0A2K9NUL9_BACTC|nr:alpha/beta fold hydrolase [Bacteriovorax stolpii]AUN99188.1 hypothetical protein C0V70_13965 [Bacteriovorax stolpii]QDK40830.1 hypothetical protein DOM21_05035 [Bacteriovorax stolpii]TDP55274.1 esterase/lipase [Bacteriovorax stolpii]
MKTLILSTLVTLTFSFNAFSSCEQTNREKFLAMNESLYQEYSKIDPNQSVTAEKRALWLEGDPKVNKAIFLAHGYMGSPGEMMFLAKPFIQKGYSVIGFLIPGHGSTYKVANEYKNTRWIKDIKEQLNLVFECFSEVRVVGFSTGGLLLHHYLLTEPTPANLKSVHFVSPYFIQRFGGFFDRILGFFVNGISVDTAYFVTRFRDLKPMTIDRQYYHQNLPVDSALQVKDLGLKVYEMRGNSQIKVPVQLFLSEGDWTVDTDATKEVVNREYEKVQLVWYKGEEPHHLMVPSVSKVASEVQHLIFSAN